MRSDDVLVFDIVDAARLIAEYTAGMDLAAFRVDSKTQSAVKHEIMLMGEAAKKVSHEFKEANLTVPWAELIQLRNFYIHVYHEVDQSRLWSTVKSLIPDVERKLTRLLPPDHDED